MTRDLFDNIKLHPGGEKPLYRQIEDNIGHLISTGKLGPGDIVPSPNYLSGKFSVSELTVRKSIKNLVNRNILFTRQGRGTFVTEEASVGKVLWICGLDIFSGDVSPYYTSMLRVAQKECNTKGLTLQPVWLSNTRPEDADSYCNIESTRKYAGYFFIGCRLTHRLLQYVQSNKLPRVVVTHEETKSYRITQDFRKSTQLGFDYLTSRSHKKIMVMCNSDNSPILRKMAIPQDIEVQLVEFSLQEKASNSENDGYHVMHELLAEGSIPSGLFIMDDIIARGVTHAILQDRSYDLEKLDIIVKTSQQEMVFYGIPTAWIVDDTDEQAKAAVRILHDQIGEHSTHPNYYVGKSKIIPASEKCLYIGKSQKMKSMINTIRQPLNQMG